MIIPVNIFLLGYRRLGRRGALGLGDAGIQLFGYSEFGPATTSGTGG